MPASEGVPFLTPISMQPPSIRDFQFQFNGDGPASMLQQNVQPLAFPPVAPPGHHSPSSGLPTMQRPQSPARLLRRPLLERLEQPRTQLMPEMRDETALSQIACSSASRTTFTGTATSHSQLSHVLHAVPPLECKAPEAADLQMQVDTDTSESTQTHQDAMDLDGEFLLPWRHPFDESDDAYSTTVSKFRLADVFSETAKVTEEWSQVERPQKRRRPPQVTSPTTSRAATKVPPHGLSPRVAPILLVNHDNDRKPLTPPNVDQAAVSNIAAAPGLEAPLQSLALAGDTVPSSSDTEKRIPRSQAPARRGEQQRAQATGHFTPNPAVQPCDSSLKIPKDIRAVPSLPHNPPGGPSARQQARSALDASLAPPRPADDSRQYVGRSEKGQLSAPEQTCQQASATVAVQPTAPSACLQHSNLGQSNSTIDGPKARSTVVMQTLRETPSSGTAVASLPPLQQVKTEPVMIKLEPSSPNLRPPAQHMRVAEFSETLSEATGRPLALAPPASPLDFRTSTPIQNITMASPPGPFIDLPNSAVETEPPSATLEQKIPTTASQPNAMTGSRSSTPALAVRLPSLGSAISQAAIPPPTESTAMEVQMTQPEQAPFVPTTPPREPNHTGPMYYSPAAPPPVSRYRRSTSPPPRGQNSIRARTPPRRVTPQSLSPRRRTPVRAHLPTRSHLHRYDIGSRNFIGGCTHRDSDGRSKRRREPIDSRMNSYPPHYTDDRPLGGFERESYHPPHEMEARDRPFLSYSRDWSRARYSPRSMETGSLSSSHHRRYSQSEGYNYCEPSGSEWPHGTRGNLEASATRHQAGSSQEHHLVNENTPTLGLSTCARLDTSLSSNPRAGSDSRSAGSTTHNRDISPGSGRSETLQVDSKVSSTGPLALSAPIEERPPASKRPREPESSPSSEELFHCAHFSNVTEPAPKRQKLDTTSSKRRTEGDSQALVRIASYRPGRTAAHSLQEDPIEDMMVPSTSQPTLADRMGVLNDSSNQRQSTPGPPRGPLISRFSYAPTLPSVSRPLENPGEISPPTVTRPLLDRFTSDEETSNQTHLHRGPRPPRPRNRIRGVPPSEPSIFRHHQPLQNRLSGGIYVKNNSLLERME